MTKSLTVGEPAPYFRAPVLDGNPDYAIDTVGGRPVVMLFLNGAADDAARAALAVVARHRAAFDDVGACFFGIGTGTPAAERARALFGLPGLRWILDDGGVTARYGATGHPHWLLLDRALRVAAVAPLDRGEALIAALPRLHAADASPAPAPVLVVPRIFSIDLCRRLIAHHEAEGGTPSGFMRDVDGVTTHRLDDSFKRRTDVMVADPALRDAVRARLSLALLPQIARAFQFEVTRVERLLVACYDADGGGFFRPHRDNTMAGTAHRRFACTINLNAEDYEGGDLAFPEFGAATYRAPTGGAVVFSCSLLHEARPILRGRRYAFLPFFYDEAGALLRERNLGQVDESLKAYRSGLTGA